MKFSMNYPIINKYTPRILHTTEFLRNFELKKRRPFKIVDMIVNNIVTKKNCNFFVSFLSKQWFFIHLVVNNESFNIFKLFFNIIYFWFKKLGFESIVILSIEILRYITKDHINKYWFYWIECRFYIILIIYMFFSHTLYIESQPSNDNFIVLKHCMYMYNYNRCIGIHIIIYQVAQSPLQSY